MTPSCELCAGDGGEVVFRARDWRVVLVDEPALPGYCRVIAAEHARELTDLTPHARAALLAAVFAVEEVLRDVLAPLKVNVASLGNLVPHVHWHVVARFAEDPFFPQPIWGSRQREPDPVWLAAQHARLPALRARLRARCAQIPQAAPSGASNGACLSQPK